MNKDLQIIQAIKSEDNKVLKNFYEENRQPFIAFLQKYSLHQDDLLDIYQDSIIALCDNVRKGKLDNLNSSIKTYLFSIGKYKVYSMLKKEQKIETLEIDLPEEMKYDVLDDFEEERILELNNSISRLGKVCQQVLKLFYYEEKKLDEIMMIMGYDNKDVIKSQKSRCLKQLKTLLSKK